MNLKTLLKFCSPVFLAIALTSCSSGTKMLKEPLARPDEAVLSNAADPVFEAQLDWVIVRDGPGTWAARADWDEYLLRLNNLSDDPIRITDITLIDSLGARVAPQVTRVELVRASKKTAKRYKNEDIEIQAGLTGYGLLGTGTALFLAGGYFGLPAAFGLVGTTGTVVASTALAVVLAGPVVMTRGLIRGFNNSVVDFEINERQTPLPFEISGNTAKPVNVFYPISPSPTRIEIAYEDNQGSHTVFLDTQAVLDGLHLGSLPDSSATEQ
ncbi:MAG: hypothetical protein OES99_04115 [Gammaproteobacteria bacterium]|nr:hypothetical protein [Gammaproteobacteria bacterium]